MTLYDVNATISFPAWYTVEAESLDAAEEAARSVGAGLFEYDTTAGEVAFDIDPMVEVR